MSSCRCTAVLAPACASSLCGPCRTRWAVRGTLVPHCVGRCTHTLPPFLYAPPTCPPLLSSHAEPGQRLAHRPHRAHDARSLHPPRRASPSRWASRYQLHQPITELSTCADAACGAALSNGGLACTRHAPRHRAGAGWRRVKHARRGGFLARAPVTCVPLPRLLHAHARLRPADAYTQVHTTYGNPTTPPPHTPPPPPTHTDTSLSSFQQSFRPSSIPWSFNLTRESGTAWHRMVPHSTRFCAPSQVPWRDCWARRVALPGAGRCSTPRSQPPPPIRCSSAAHRTSSCSSTSSGSTSTSTGSVGARCCHSALDARACGAPPLP